MRKQQIEHAAFEVATQVRAVEDTIDSALAEIAELQARIMRVNGIAAVSVKTVHPAIEQLAAAIHGLVGARGRMADCHSALVEAKGKVPGLRTVMYGDVEDDCPEIASSQLRVVA